MREDGGVSMSFRSSPAGVVPYAWHSGEGPMLQLMLVVALVFAVGVAVFAVQNTAPVEVAFLLWRAQGVAASAGAHVCATTRAASVARAHVFATGASRA
jgi:uncharacterized integral membrane protein